MVRKSKEIGKTRNGLTLIDSFYNGKDTMYVVKCENCGEVNEISRYAYYRKVSGCPNCGTFPRKDRNTKGYVNTKLYKIYMSMLRRTEYQMQECEHKRSYKDRGIRICDEWRNDFTKFMEWALNNGYEDGLTIDRIDNDKGYAPDNCRWATIKQQANNRRSNVRYEFDGKMLTLSEISDICHIPRKCLYQRMYKNKVKLTLEEAINKPYEPIKHRVH